jgi:F-box interacting protein
MHNNNHGYLLYKKRPIVLKRKKKPLLADEDLCTVVCNNDHTLTEISRFKIPCCDALIVGFCNGIFCLTTEYDGPPNRFRKNSGYLSEFRQNGIIYLWNPSIRKFKKLLATNFNNHSLKVAVGLAYHSQNNDFKVLRIVRFMERRPAHAEVYTLSTDSWRKVGLSVESLNGSGSIGCIDYIDASSPSLFFNGALHSIAYVKEHKFILAFDVDDEKFREIRLPEEYKGGFSMNIEQIERLAVFKGSLALISYKIVVHTQAFNIWVMRDYGVVESWTKKVVKLENVTGFFGCSSSGELMITKYYDPVLTFSFDPESRKENELGFEVPEAYTANFMESLVLLNGGLAITN